MSGPGDTEIEIPVPLARSLGVVSTSMLGLGAMIGAGIFVLIGHASALAGPAIVLAFVLNAGFALTVGACYAELAVAFPRTGGAYVWVGEAFGRRVGFIAGFCSWGAQTIACALYALGFGVFAVEIARRASPAASWLSPCIVAAYAGTCCIRGEVFFLWVTHLALRACPHHCGRSAAP